MLDSLTKLSKIIFKLFCKIFWDINSFRWFQQSVYLFIHSFENFKRKAITGLNKSVEYLIYSLIKKSPINNPPKSVPLKNLNSYKKGKIFDRYLIFFPQLS